MKGKVTFHNYQMTDGLNEPRVSTEGTHSHFISLLIKARPKLVIA